MFLINKQKKDILILSQDGSIKRLSGDFDRIFSEIKKKFTRQQVEALFCINHYIIGNKLGENALTIFSKSHNTKFIVANELVREKGIKVILSIILGLTKKMFKKIIYLDPASKYILFSNKIEYPNLEKNTKIKTEEDLYQAGMVTSKKEIECGGARAVTNFSLGLGQYEKWAIETTASGYDENISIAAEKSISEAVERLSASIFPKKTTYLSTEEYLMHNYQQEVFEYFLKDGELEKLPCVETKEFFSDESIYLPYNLIFYPYYLHKKVWHANSSGMATHLSKKQAIKGCIYEIIERDSFISARLLKTGFYKMKLPGKFQKFKTHFKELGYNLHTFIIYLKNESFLPVTMLVLEKDKKILTCLGCDTTIEKSIQSGIYEALHTWTVMERGVTKQETIESPVKFHIYYYLQEKNFQHISWLLNKSPTPFHQLKETIPSQNYDELLKNLYKKGVKLLTYQYDNKLNNIFQRKTCRVHANHFLPIYFGKNIPSTVKNHPKLQRLQKKYNVTKLHQAVHPLG